MSENKNKEGKQIDPIDNSLETSKILMESYVHTDEKSNCNTNIKEENKSPSSIKDEQEYINKRYYIIWIIFRPRERSNSNGKATPVCNSEEMKKNVSKRLNFDSNVKENNNNSGENIINEFKNSPPKINSSNRKHLPDYDNYQIGGLSGDVKIVDVKFWINLGNKSCW